MQKVIIKFFKALALRKGEQIEIDVTFRLIDGQVQKA